MKKDMKQKIRTCSPLTCLALTSDDCNSLDSAMGPDLSCQERKNDNEKKDLLAPEGQNGDAKENNPLPYSPLQHCNRSDLPLHSSGHDSAQEEDAASLSLLDRLNRSQQGLAEELLEGTEDNEQTLKNLSSSMLLSPDRGNIDNILSLLQRKCGNGRINLCPVVQLIDITKDKGRLSEDLQSSGVKLDCTDLGEEGCCEDNQQGDKMEMPSEMSSMHYNFFSSPSLANGIRSPEEKILKKPRIGPRGRRRHIAQQRELQHMTPQPEVQQQDLMPDPIQQASQKEELETQPEVAPALLVSQEEIVTLDVTEEQPLTMPQEIIAPLEPVEPMEEIPVHSPMTANPIILECQPIDIIPTSMPMTNVNATIVHASTPEVKENTLVSQLQQQISEKDNSSMTQTPETERKYSLRSLHRPRIQCHLRKSSRLRRSLAGCTKERKNRMPAPSVDVPLQIIEEPLQLLDDDCEKAQGDFRQGSNDQDGIIELKSYDTEQEGSEVPIESLIELEAEPLEETDMTRGKKRGRCVGVRKIVVKVARIPVNMGRRSKSYKISSVENPAVLDTMTGIEGKEANKGPPREPAALLKMKNNGKNVMVMFPPGELPVILKRRRGRPPKQVPPGQPDPRLIKANEVKKPRRRRRVKLASPQPSYVADTNDAKTDYGDVLSKLAFLNRQPPTTGRCSPPRCWTPTEPKNTLQSPDTPNIAILIQRLQGFRRRGGRAGCMGGRGGLANANESFKRSFSDFFETIGKKRKSPPSDSHFPRKRGRAASVHSYTAPSAEKVIRKRRPRKNGILKGAQQGMNQDSDWSKGSSWPTKSEGRQNQAEKSYGYQNLTSSRSFVACDAAKGGFYSSQTQGNQESQGLFTGYFRSLLDSDDSSDLIDFSMSSQSSRAESHKLPGCFETANAAQCQRWSPVYQKRCPKASPNSSESVSQASNLSRSAYPQGGTGTGTGTTTGTYSLSQTSPTSFQKMVPPLSLSRSPSSPHPAGSFSHYPGFGSGSQSMSSTSNASLPTMKQFEGQRNPDCSFPYGTGSSKPLQVSPGSSSSTCFAGLQGTNPLGKCIYSSGHFQGIAHTPSLQGENHGRTASPGNFMHTKNTNESFPSSPESCRQYSSTAQWGYRPSYPGSGGVWNTDSFRPHFPGSFDYGTYNEPKDILDISNYTPQKVKQRSFSETFSESSSDSSHFGQQAPVASTGSSYKQHDPPPPPPASAESQSSLSSLEKLMMDWNETSSAPSYNWNQSVLFQGGTKPGRGRRKKAETQAEACHLGFPPVPSPSSSSSPIPGPKRGSMGGRHPRGSRGGFSSCRRERTTLAKPKAHKQPNQPSAMPLFQDSPDLGMDYYSGDSSSMSPLSSQSQNLGLSEREQCGYSSPYSVNPSTPSSEEKFTQIFHNETASLSPVVGLQLESKSFQSPPSKPPHPYGGHSKAFSPNCSPTLAYKDSNSLMPCDARRLLSCAAQSPHRVGKDMPGSQYDSPPYSSSAYWYQQSSSLTGSPHHYEKRDEFLERNNIMGTSPHLLNSISLGRTEKDTQEMPRGGPLRPTSSYPPLSVGPNPLVASSSAAVEMNSPPSGLNDPGLQVSLETYHLRYPSLQTHGQAGLSLSSHHGGVLSQLLDQHAEDTFTVTSL
uniref:AT-hook DNA binding motif containing 1 n=2 Tax=Erpetoichthys calabaricus TaxID=27687 RepID=A0A8C4T266_ERPCA